MSNVLRVLGIVAASMLLGLAGLFIALFTICGGLQSSDGSGILAICLVVMAGAVTVIVLLGRGLSGSRRATRGLAVMPVRANGPASAAPHMPPSPGPHVAARVVARPFTGTDRQALMGLRILLVVLILLSLGSMALDAANFSRYGSSVTIQWILRSILGLLPPAAILVALSVRNPPAGAALDAAAGLGIASILFRFGFLGFSGLVSSGLSPMPDLTVLLLRMGVYSALEAGATGLALYLRSRLGPFQAAGLIVATVAFLFWDGLIHVVMQALLALAS